MDWRKDYKLRELWKPLLAQYRRRLRRRQPLLVLSLPRASVSYWQQGQMLWSRQLQAAEDMTAIQDELRQLLLEQEAEEGISTLLVPPASTLHSEQLILPLLPQKEMEQALAWEAEHCVPWEAGSYSYAYSVSDAAAENGQQQVQLQALPDELRKAWEQVCQGLLLRLEHIVLNQQAEEQQLAQAWYAGAALQRMYRKQQTRSLQLPLAAVQRWLPPLACTVLVLSLLAYGGALCGRYLAQHELQNVQQQLAQYADWQERQRESKNVEKQIQQLQSLLQEARAAAVRPSSDIETLCRQMRPGAWLTSLEYSGTRKPLLLRGQAVDAQAVQALAERLQQSGKYSRVELLETQQQGSLAAYRLQLLAKEGGGNAEKD